MSRYECSLLLLVMAAASAARGEQVYRCVHADGHVSFQQTECTGRG